MELAEILRLPYNCVQRPVKEMRLKGDLCEVRVGIRNCLYDPEEMVNDNDGESSKQGAST